MEISSLLPLPVQPSLALYIILPIITLYCGIYLIIFNNYILRPRIEPFLQKLSISSRLFIQLFLDIVSNLSFITYAISASFMTTLTDQPIRIMSMYCLYWITIFMGIAMYYIKSRPKNRNKNKNSTTNQYTSQQGEQSSKLIIGKNGIMLVLCFASLLYHYFSQNWIISLPATLIGLYVLNIFISMYEEKFIGIVQELLNIKKSVKPKPKQKWHASLPSIESLSSAYPVTEEEIIEQMKSFKKKINYKQNNKLVNNKIMGISKLDTKIIARQRLFKICLCLHLSMKKKQQQQIKNVQNYFGFINGTLGDQMTSNNYKTAKLNDKTYFNNRNKDKQLITRHKQRKTYPPSQINKISQKTNIKLFSAEADYVQQQIYNQIVQPESLLFYVFPVRIFQSSKIITAIFGIGANLVYGFLLNYCQNLMNTLKYGRYCQLIISAMLLPIIPQISSLQYFNTMALSSLWKFGFCALLWLFYIISNNSTDLTMNWITTSYLQYQIIIQLILLIIVMILVLKQNKVWKTVIGLGIIGLATNLWMIYLNISNN